MWALSPDIRHLNHGSFSAVPVEVQQAQDEWRKRWEANTTAFIFTDYQPALDRARQVLAGFVGADEAGLVFVRNATTGVASVLRSLEPSVTPGDELLTTSHDYNAVRQTLEYSAMVTGARVVVVDVPLTGPRSVLGVGRVIVPVPVAVGLAQVGVIEVQAAGLPVMVRRLVHVGQTGHEAEAGTQEAAENGEKPAHRWDSKAAGGGRQTGSEAPDGRSFLPLEWGGIRP